VIFTARSEAAGLYFILEGQVRVVREVGGRAHVIHEEGAGGTLGEVPLYEGGRYPATAIAATRMRCVVISFAAIRAAVQQDPDVAFVLLARLARRVRRLVDQLDSRTGYGTLQRLAGFILERAGDASRDGKTFTLGSTQHEVAETLGTVRELVVRGIRSLRNDGILGSEGPGRYILLDRALLEEIAAGGAAATSLKGMTE
jgi:CRP/FNR family transcriptional regulator